ncbi:LOW QUALITY PROTEIN: Hypothetical protein PHPALM_12068 [Phytophthora palmivora]|uniref:Uncharacterized protein n=1 Tax=Phytophthora palmivora TaxID=4796 RepID=A0A2P4Y0Q0_9STRA|nr:LOW QUALITY PROTEIN: Hypothetical protein PHPALM_12068 [Phytophthora palmivora]
MPPGACFLHRSKISLMDYTRRPKKSETNGGLHPGAGSLTRLPSKAEAQLEFISIQQALRVQFTCIVAKRQLVTEMESATVFGKPAWSRLPALINSWGIPATSLAAGAPRSAAALGRHAPREHGAWHSDQGGQEELSHTFEYEAPSQPYTSGFTHSGPDPAESFLQDEVHQPRDRIYAIEIALGIGIGGLVDTQSGKPTAPDVLRQDVGALGRENRELHGRVNRRVPASA